MRALRALGAALVLLVLVVGIPAGLWALGTPLLPSALPTWDQIQLLLTNPLSGNFLVGALVVVGWVAWLTFTIAVLLEVAALLRGRRPPRLPALGAQQRLAAVLLAAIILGLSSVPAASAATSPAHSARPSVSIATQVAPLTPASDPQNDPGDPDDGVDAAPQASTQRTYEVQPGDTLWNIAATHLGDGNRWKEIADLNYGLLQPDGATLTDAHWIEPGWQLQLPPDTSNPTTSQSAAEEQIVTVQAGDTLYDLAQEHLGDGAQYPQIVAATQGLQQPGGQYLTDPDEIFPGWQVVIPNNQTTQTSPEQTSQESDDLTPTPDQEPIDETQEPTQDTTEPTSTAPDEEASDAGQEHGQVDADENEEAATESAAWAPVALRTTGGVGALLAAGVVALVLARRRQTSRTSPPGARLALPEPDTAAAEFEQELHAIADPIGRDSVNAVLRDLAAQARTTGDAAPPVLYVRYAGDGSELQLYLTEPTDLPQPWAGSTDHRIWSITDADLAQILDRTDPQDVPSAYPALVGLGLGDQDTHLLVDLERLGHLDLRGDQQTADGVMAALLLELVSSKWADDLQITVVGGHHQLIEALQSQRVLHLPTIDQALDRLDTLSRAQHTADRQWPPEAMFIATDLSEQDRNILAAATQAAPTGLAVITLNAAFGAVAVELRSGTLDATLQPSNMAIQVQHLVQTECSEIIEAVEAKCVPGPDWTATLSRAREPAVDDLPEADPREELPDLPRPDTLFELENASPQIRVLGPVELVGADTSVLSGTIGHLHAAVEMTAYLSMRGGATAEQLTRDLWPNQEVKAATRHSAVSRTRRLLGTAPDGRSRLESEPGTGAGAHRSRYVLTDVDSDWDAFTHLHGPDPSKTPLPDLRRALMLVRGAPFSQVRDGVGRVRANRYLWSDALGVEMTASIVDVACETARRALTEGKPRLAAEAADAGLRASADHERLWRYAIKARTQLGEHAAAAELAEALTLRLTELDVDPEPETNALLDDIEAAAQRAS